MKLPLTRRRGSQCLGFCTNKVAHAHACLPSGSLRFGDVLARACLCNQHPETHGRHQVSAELLGQCFLHVVTTRHWRKTRVLCGSTGRGPLQPGTWFPPDVAPRACPFRCFCVFPFTVVKLGHEYMLNPGSPSRESLNSVRLVPGTLTQLSQLSLQEPMRPELEQ